MEWVRGKKLGQGSFATVSLALPKRQSPISPPLMAVKSCGASLSSSLAAEKSILDELKGCPQIIRCFGDSVSRENGERLYNVLLEYASGGNLADKVKSSGGRGLPEFEVRRHAKALLKGLNYIHGSGYVHCDVKLQNILLCADGGAKIADFGLARRAGRSGAVLSGTPMYMSPEMVLAGEQGAPADIWAMGCAVAEMAGGAPAWGGFSDLAALMMRIGVGDEVPEVPGNLSDQGKDFLGKCFVRDPSQRWTAGMLLKHPFIIGGADSDDDDDDDDGVAAFKARQTASASPRCPFGFVDWVSSPTCSITSLPSPGDFPQSGSCFSQEPPIAMVMRVSALKCERGPDWSVSDAWLTIR
ncbi:mitogen-activated protein kinase kinase kinase a [Phtheirospermum japonicum]|uniref:Mitogen-activated protein kinase kinase kinase a n=1 Tax=Phtheirospermum japonicum TaxID=374723 RepID=A0A830BY28_9LAMI|nr:mitogen-activated protein kinase kinase kinase a [Phtheirospermum japonicum]